MVKDLNPDTNSSAPQNLTDVNGTVFFTGQDNSGNRELFKTDGKAAGTAELTFGGRLSNFGNLVNLGGKLFFSASDSVLGYNALWTSDGTVAGTHPFVVCSGNVAVYNPTGSAQALVGNKLFFDGYDPANNQYDLWVSDGTSAGTHPVQPGTTTSQLTGGNLAQFTNVSGTLFFQSYDSGTHSYTLWKSNGTAAGTGLVAELTASQPMYFTAVGSLLYFEMYDSAHGLNALWLSTGNIAILLADIGTTANTFTSLTSFGNKLWFQVYDPGDAPNTNWALWSSDSYAASSGPFKFNGGTTAVQVGANTQMTALGSNLYFQGWNSTNSYSLWKTDGVSSHNATGAVQTSGTPFNNTPTVLTAVGTELFFNEYDSTFSTYDLWKSDGTSAGTVPVQTGALFAHGVGQSGDIVASGGKAFFDAWDINPTPPFFGSVHGDELWSSDGTAAGTAMVADINTTTNDSDLSYFTAVGSEVFFQDTIEPQWYLYQSDGSAAGTVLVQTSAGVLPPNPYYPTAVGNTLFFEANGPDGAEVWTSGTAPDSASPFQHGGSEEIALDPFDFVNDNGVAYFFAYDSAHSAWALWKSDGTQAGTVPLADLPTNTGLYNLTVAGSNLFFSEWDSAHNTGALWEYNGASASQVADVGNINDMTAIGSSVFFQTPGGNNNNPQYALWTSNGTTTTELSINPFIYYLTPFNGKVFFDAYDSAAGYDALWMSDGTVAGTQVYLTSGGTPVEFGSAGPSLTVMGGDLYFDNVFGPYQQLGRTDGTPGGFVEVQAGSSAPVAQSPQDLVNDNGILVFAGYDSAHGNELWQSNGAFTGTMLAADIWPGPNPGSPWWMTVAGNQLYFMARDGVHGFQLWCATLAPDVVTTGLSGPTDGVTEQYRDFVLTAADSNTADNPAGFSFAINWGDGTSETVTGPSGLTVDHSYATAGNYLISATATNLADSVTSAAFTQMENITATEVQGGNLALGGQVGNDAWVITKGTKNGTYTVKVNGTTLVSNFTPATGEEIFLYGGNGTNTYTVNDTGTTADPFTLGTGFVTFIKATLVPQSPGTWTVNGNNGNDTFTISGAANASITGGSGKNTFSIATGGSLSGTLNGGSGTQNTLSYGKYTTGGVVVDLPLGSATAVNGGAPGGISNIQNVTGAANGGDILVGDGNPNVLKANKGHNVLIGGAGSDTLTAGSGGDILIAGTTSYDSNLVALQTILTTWKTSTPTTYASVLSTLQSSAFADPLNAATVFDDAATDVLNGNMTGRLDDWFFAHTTGSGPLDTVANAEAGETVTQT
jgi:ELWxxDGT repeat protein